MYPLKRTAIFVDGAFFIKRFRLIYPDLAHDPIRVARTMHRLALEHLNSWEKNRFGKPEKVRVAELFRIYFYDCPPLQKKVHLPVSRTPLDFSTTEAARFRYALHDEIRKLRKVELRLGRLDEQSSRWVLRNPVQKDLLSGRILLNELVDEDFSYVFRPKLVDMKMGLDLASLAYKRLVDQVVLLAGDGDFVPAAELARQEGIDFILDPMWQRISSDLNGFIDGLRSTSRNPDRRDYHQEVDELEPIEDDQED